MKGGSPLFAMVRVGVVGLDCGTAIPWQILLPLQSDCKIYPASASIRQKHKKDGKKKEDFVFG